MAGARIRPVTPFVVRPVKFGGTARWNDGSQQIQGAGTYKTDNAVVQGNGVVHVFVGNRIASGALAWKKVKIGVGAALARRHAAGTGAIPSKKIALAGTAARIQAVAAVIQRYDNNNNPSGFGPVDDPQGAFFGDTSLVVGDVWWVTNVTAGVTMTIFAGGTYHATGLTPGAAWSFTRNLRRTIGGVRSSVVISTTMD